MSSRGVRSSFMNVYEVRKREKVVMCCDVLCRVVESRAVGKSAVISIAQLPSSARPVREEVVSLGGAFGAVWWGTGLSL